MRVVSFLALALALPVSGIESGGRPSHNVPRTILAIYDKHVRAQTRDTAIHRLLETPLNHLGLILEYHDVNSALPPIATRPDVRGVITWLSSDSMQNPDQFLSWAEGVLDANRKFVVLGQPGAPQRSGGTRTSAAKVDHLLERIGVRGEHDFTGVTYSSRIIRKDPGVVEFERKYPTVLPKYEIVHAIEPFATSHLRIKREKDVETWSDVVITSPTGAYVADGFTHYESAEAEQIQWYLNPFEFFRIVFRTDEYPKPDTTTLVGRRLYYSQIDGDGWRNRTEVSEFRQQNLTSAEVILRRAVLPYSDLPVSVAPIAGDLDPAWYGSRETQRVAREYFALPWVEAATHTYSHPLDWEYLSKAENSDHGLDTGMPRVEAFARLFGVTDYLDKFLETPVDEADLSRGHTRPRSYNLRPFEIDFEVNGSVKVIESLCPPGKKVQLMQWSGSTFPFEKFLKAVRKAGLRNINGGDTRLDDEFPSYAWVMGLSRQVGQERQIYSSASNENTYTNKWSDRYFGFRYWKKTIDNTGAPRRVKPVDLYYHMFSGEKAASLNALIENLNYARTLELTPVTASHYASIVDGFFSTQIEELNPGVWQLSNRDGLNTVRFDQAGVCIDYDRSRGILGSGIANGSLYVAIDPAAPVAVLATSKAPCNSRIPFLIESRWPIEKLQRTADGFRFTAQGFGKGQMSWHVRPQSNWVIEVSGSPKRMFYSARASEDGTLHLAFDGVGQGPLQVSVSRLP